eukprot:8486523-Alexandrium_andersonii.AAC.1
MLPLPPPPLPHADHDSDSNAAINELKDPEAQNRQNHKSRHKALSWLYSLPLPKLIIMRIAIQ